MWIGYGTFDLKDGISDDSKMYKHCDVLRYLFRNCKVLLEGGYSDGREVWIISPKVFHDGDSTFDDNSNNDYSDNTFDLISNDHYTWSELKVKPLRHDDEPNNRDAPLFGVYQTRDDGARDDGTRDSGIRDDGIRDDGTRDDGIRGDGIRDDAIEDDGTTDDGIRDDGIRGDETRDDVPRSKRDAETRDAVISNELGELRYVFIIGAAVVFIALGCICVVFVYKEKKIEQENGNCTETSV